MDAGSWHPSSGPPLSPAALQVTPALQLPGTRQEKSQRADPNCHGDRDGSGSPCTTASKHCLSSGLRVPPCGLPTSQGPLDLSSSWRPVPLSRKMPHQFRLCCLVSEKRWARPARRSCGSALSRPTDTARARSPEPAAGRARAERTAAAASALPRAATRHSYKAQIRNQEVRSEWSSTLPSNA